MKPEKIFSFCTGLAVMFLFAPHAFNQNSVLSVGVWHKLAITESGIYKITYNDLLNVGINPTMINPKFIRIYGNGGNMLPEINNAFRYEDLVENAIVVSGEDDNVFDPGDFILFFGEEPVTWTLNEPGGYFRHKLNTYSEKTCYFLNFDTGPGKRIEVAEPVSEAPTHIRSTYSARKYNELEEVNLIRSGRRWFGESFQDQLTYTWNFDLPHMDASSQVLMEVALAARSSDASHLNVKINSNPVKLVEVNPVAWNSTLYARFKQDTAMFSPLINPVVIELEYIQANDSSAAWLDYFSLNYRDSLILDNNPLQFRDITSVGTGQVTLFRIKGANADTKIWNFTDRMNIKSVSGNLSGDLLEFKTKTDSLQEFIAFSGNNFNSPDYVGVVENQNLRGADPVDYVIVAHDDFKTHAGQLAAFHESIGDLTTMVVTTGQVYNEFSSGIQDISAIRDFLKQMYDKSGGGKPQYLLLFGTGSFDYKNILAGNNHFVPAWQSSESLNLVSSMCTDDYYGWLDNGEGIEGYMDIGIGRLPVKTGAEATAMVNKIISYASDPATFGNWKNEVCYTADDGDINLHLDQAEELALISAEKYNVTKNYLDFYTLVQTPEGPRYPEANALINEKINVGLFMINYIGHGSPESLAEERVVESDDIETWENSDRLPVMIASACNFARFDDPEINSGGVQAVLKEYGGIIGLFGAVRSTYASSSYEINKSLIELFVDQDNSIQTLGGMMHHAKTMQLSTQRAWTLLGDPALRISFPNHAVHTDSINGVFAGLMTDTVAPGSPVAISGHVANMNGDILADYNGTLSVKVFERPYERLTLGNQSTSVIVPIVMQDSVLLTVETEVVNGQFSFNFSLPVDMDEEYGLLRLSYYAYNSNEDASGNYTQIMVGGQVSSVPELALDNAFVQLYPTIASGHFYIVTSGQTHIVDLQLFDLTGKQAFSRQITGITGGIPFRVDLPHLKPGLYLAQLQTGNAFQTVKVVIR
jgi:hypothetical protein